MPKNHIFGRFLRITMIIVIGFFYSVARADDCVGNNDGIPTPSGTVTIGSTNPASNKTLLSLQDLLYNNPKSTGTVLNSDGVVKCSGATNCVIKETSNVAEYNRQLGLYLEGSEWSVRFDTGVVTGYGVCAASGWYNATKTGKLTNTFTGCSCALSNVLEQTAFTAQRFVGSNSKIDTSTSDPIVVRNDRCREDCASVCANLVATDASFRSTLFNNTCPVVASSGDDPEPTEYTITYVDEDENSITECGTNGTEQTVNDAIDLCTPQTSVNGCKWWDADTYDEYDLGQQITDIEGNMTFILVCPTVTEYTITYVDSDNQPVTQCGTNGTQTYTESVQVCDPQISITNCAWFDYDNDEVYEIGDTISATNATLVLECDEPDHDCNSGYTWSDADGECVCAGYEADGTCYDSGDAYCSATYGDTMYFGYNEEFDSYECMSKDNEWCVAQYGDTYAWDEYYDEFGGRCTHDAYCENEYGDSYWKSSANNGNGACVEKDTAYCITAYGSNYAWDEYYDECTHEAYCETLGAYAWDEYYDEHSGGACTHDAYCENEYGSDYYWYEGEGEFHNSCQPKDTAYCIAKYDDTYAWDPNEDEAGGDCTHDAYCENEYGSYYYWSDAVESCDIDPSQEPDCYGTSYWDGSECWCDYGYYNGETCIECDEDKGEYFDHEYNKCHIPCNDGSTYNPVTNKCECPQNGYEYDIFSYTCVDSNTMVQCPSGYYLPQGSNHCAQCERGYYCPDADKGKLTPSEYNDVGIKSCADDYFYDTEDYNIRMGWWGYNDYAYTDTGEAIIGYTSDPGTSRYNDCYLYFEDNETGKFFKAKQKFQYNGSNRYLTYHGQEDLVKVDCEPGYWCPGGKVFFKSISDVVYDYAVNGLSKYYESQDGLTGMTMPVLYGNTNNAYTTSYVGAHRCPAGFTSLPNSTAESDCFPIRCPEHSNTLVSGPIAELVGTIYNPALVSDSENDFPYDQCVTARIYGELGSSLSYLGENIINTFNLQTIVSAANTQQTYDPQHQLNENSQLSVVFCFYNENTGNYDRCSAAYGLCNLEKEIGFVGAASDSVKDLLIQMGSFIGEDLLSKNIAEFAPYYSNNIQPYQTSRCDDACGFGYHEDTNIGACVETDYPCEAGWYLYVDEINEIAECRLCEIGSYCSNSYTYYSIEDDYKGIRECPSGSTTYEQGATSCECTTSGYEWDYNKNTCVLKKYYCNSGEYVNINLDQCTNCEINYWCPGGTLDVINNGLNQCPVNSSTNNQMGLSQCICSQLGYSWRSKTGGSCELDNYSCNAGYYLDVNYSNNTILCEQCQPGNYCSEEADDYTVESKYKGTVACPANSSNNAYEATSCLCDPGYEWTDLFDTDVYGESYGAIQFSGDTPYFGADYAGLSAGQWKVNFPYGTIWGHAACLSESSATLKSTYTEPNTSHGGNCYVAVYEYTDKHNVEYDIHMPWVLTANYEDAETCALKCGKDTALNIITNELNIREKVLTAITKPNLYKCSLIDWRIIYMDGAEQIGEGSYTVQTNEITLLQPVKPGASFIDWYDNAEFNGAPIRLIEDLVAELGDKTLYAKWEIVDAGCPIGYVQNGDDCEPVVQNCDPGRYLVIENDSLTCKLCEEDYYCIGGDVTIEENGRHDCPEFSYSAEGSSACICEVEDKIWNGEECVYDWSCVAGSVPDDSNLYFPKDPVSVTDVTEFDDFLVSGGTNSYSLLSDDYLDQYLEGEEWSVTFGTKTISGWAGCSANSWKTMYDSKNGLSYVYAGCACSLDKQRWVVYGNVLSGSSWEDKTNYCRANCPERCAYSVAQDKRFRDALFNGVCPDGDTIPDGETNCGENEFEYLGQCIENKFQITTVEDVHYFAFNISAAGEFYVDCGPGGRFVSTNDQVGYIDRTLTTDPTRYSCSWSDNNTESRIIKIGREEDIIGYSVADNVAAISFGNIEGQQNSYHLLKSISGSLGALFPTIDEGDSLAKQPRFYRTFYQCDNLSGSIPSGLFSGLSGKPVVYMFYATFMECANLEGEIPHDLFADISGRPAEYMFDGTFSNCSKLGTVNGVSLYGIPHDLFANIQGETVEHMFPGTFYGCAGLTESIPPDLFSGVYGRPKTRAFAATFEGCSGLSGTIPEKLFENISGDMWAKAFRRTFKDTGNLQGSVPVNLFENITYDSAVSEPMLNIFENSGIVTKCPKGYYKHDLALDEFWDGRVACDWCGEGRTTATSGALSESECYYTTPGNIIYNYANGGSGCSNETYMPGEEKELTCVPSKNGYAFKGWYDAQFGGNKIESILSNVAVDIVLYAQWEEIVGMSCNDGIWLHVGTEKMCLKPTQETHPALAVKIGSDKYYGRMTQTTSSNLPITKDANQKMHVMYGGTLYNIHDASADIQ